MFKITEDMLIDLCASYATYDKGRKYYMNDRVRTLDYDIEENSFKSYVAGSDNYEVNIRFNTSGWLTNAECNCPAHREYWGYCKHIVAVLMKIRERDRKGDYEAIKPKVIVNDILNFFAYKQSEIKKAVNIEVYYEFDNKEYRNIDTASSLSLKIGEDKLYIVKSIKKLFEAIENGERIHYGKEFTFDPSIHKFKEEDETLINFLKEIYDNDMIISENIYGHGKFSLFKGKSLYLMPGSLKRFFSIMKGRSLKARIAYKDYENVEIVEEDIPINFYLTKNNRELQLEVGINDTLIPLVPDGEYFFCNDKIYKVSRNQQENFAPIYNALVKQNNNIIKIPNEYRERFVSEVYPFISNIGSIQIDDKVQSSIYKIDLRPEIYLDRVGDSILADVKFIYGDIIINPFSSLKNNNEKTERILIRDVQGEKEILSMLEEAEFKVKDNCIHIDDAEKIYAFIMNTIPKLQVRSYIFYSDEFNNMRVYGSSSFSVGVRLNPKKDILEFNFEIDDIDSSELGNIFSAIKEKKKYFRLKNGSFLPLDSMELNNMSNLFEYLGFGKSSIDGSIIEIPKFRAAYIDEYLKESGIRNINRNLLFKELVQNIKEPNDTDYNVPSQLNKVLRGYQNTGFKWLKILTSYGLGGILADDMGLGKTLQVIAFLLSEKLEKGHCPSLVVAPTSLVYNWASEVEKFAPELKTLVISGNKEERQNVIDDIMDYDIVVTSYPLIRRDIELYNNTTFRYCIIDEAQHIKNPASQNAKSVKEVRASNYFALTGTPIENSLTELWSIFDFIMPGYLFSHGKFSKRYEKPIAKDNDKKAANDLSKQISPFILRRLKKDVLKELPEKIENKVVVELTHEQKKIYLAYLQAIKGEIETEIKDKGYERSHIKILSGLTRLRQICCHPSTFIEDYKGDSGKLLLLEEILSDSIDSGHRVLLFSQFTSMLSIIRRDILEKNNIEYMYLDGSTDPFERGMLVKAFNEGKGKVFVISLKAGGTGLNLTGADTVIHYDPWWNPAVEEQATDRAHRIGQENTVHVLKLVTKGTIEEKIFELQERKRQLIDSVIHPGETMISSLSEEEIKGLFEIK